MEVPGLAIIKDFLDKEVDRLVEILFFTSSFDRNLFERFREVLAEYLVPGGTIGVSENVLELGERFLPAPVKPGTGLIELGECLFEEELNTKGTTVDADLCFRNSTLELIFLR